MTALPRLALVAFDARQSFWNARTQVILHFGAPFTKGGSAGGGGSAVEWHVASESYASRSGSKVERSRRCLALLDQMRNCFAPSAPSILARPENRIVR